MLEHCLSAKLMCSAGFSSTFLHNQDSTQIFIHCAVKHHYCCVLTCTMHYVYGENQSKGLPA